jgi:hypothetical protein
MSKTSVWQFGHKGDEAEEVLIVNKEYSRKA